MKKIHAIIMVIVLIGVGIAGLFTLLQPRDDEREPMDILQTGSLNLGTVVFGAYRDDAVKGIVNMLDEENPLYIMPVGRI
jgi:hypothetical protein